MKCDITAPPNPLVHDPKHPASITFTAQKEEEHTLMLGLIAACEPRYKGILNKAFNQIAIDVMRHNQLHPGRPRKGSNYVPASKPVGKRFMKGSAT